MCEMVQVELQSGEGSPSPPLQVNTHDMMMHCIYGKEVNGIERGALCWEMGEQVLKRNGSL